LETQDYNNITLNIKGRVEKKYEIFTLIDEHAEG